MHEPANDVGFSSEVLAPDLPFGAVVTGLKQDMLDDAAVRASLMSLFEDRGLILFRDVYGLEMQVALSEVFGPSKDHPIAGVGKVDGARGVIDMRYTPEDGQRIELDGRPLANWLPWHFDHCYSDTINRGGVLRAVVISPDGGLTGFLDGIAAYEAFPPALRAKIEGLKIVYRMELEMDRWQFGRPAGLREISAGSVSDRIMRDRDSFPRAVHPVVFERQSDGRKVLHVSPWMAVGIQGQEDQAGEALLEEIIAQMVAHTTPYFHQWQAGDMLAWDNWRMLHSVTGSNPDFERRMQRTTIVGDYGLGSFESGASRHASLEMTV